MKKEVADKWVEALRSGKYKQGKERLKDDGRYCCLGVLCELSSLGEFKPHTDASGFEAYDIEGWKSSSFLPHEVQTWAGMRSSTGILPGGNGKDRTLYLLNDVKGFTFAEIADVIEKHWEAL